MSCCRVRYLLVGIAWFATCSSFGFAGERAGRSPDAAMVLPATSLSLSSASLATGQNQPVAKETTTVRIKEDDTSWEIDGPVFLRSADPEPPGEVIVKNIFEWEHHREGTEADERDSYEYEIEVEWGVVENHELIFEVPFEIGDGRVEGNGDLTVGWHWRLWEEGDWPALALRNFVRFPTGIDSNGVDYEIRGLITKTITPGSTRFHVNPFAKSVNGDNEPEARHLHWGTAIGVDHWLQDNLLLIADYIYSNGEDEDTRDNHEGELGLDWHIDDRQTLGLAVIAGLDGDDNGPAAGARISYMLSFGGK